MLFVGQAPADEEVVLGRPLVGTSGRELDRMLRIAQIARSDLAVTNVFDEQIPENNIETLLVDAPIARRAIKHGEWPGYNLPPIKRGKFLHPAWSHHVLRLAAEVDRIKPNLIVTLGDEALWALTTDFGITKKRGSVRLANAPWMPTRDDGYDIGQVAYKVLPTYHPAYITRVYDKRIPMISDLIKARREASWPEIRHTPRELWLMPTMEDLWEFKRLYLDNATIIGVDIETSLKTRQITAICFAPRRDLALCVPFMDEDCRRRYWPSHEVEREAWRYVREVSANSIPKVLQNGPYDAQWLWEQRRVKLVNYRHDTRLLHHALYPELPKDLRTLGSMYEDEVDWKGLRNRKGEKRDE